MNENKFPPLPNPKFTETIRGVPCITVTEHEHLMRAYAQQAQQTKCACGDRPVDQCDEEWGPNCDLGNNEKYVRVVHQPSVTVRYDLSPAMVEGAIRDRLIAMGWTPPLQQPKPQPMTDDEIEIAYQHTASKQSFMSFRHGIRSAEAHHGITAQAKKEQA